VTIALVQGEGFPQRSSIAAQLQSTPPALHSFASRHLICLHHPKLITPPVIRITTNSGKEHPANKKTGERYIQHHSLLTLLGSETPKRICKKPK